MLDLCFIDKAGLSGSQIHPRALHMAAVASKAGIGAVRKLFGVFQITIQDGFCDLVTSSRNILVKTARVLLNRTYIARFSNNTHAAAAACFYIRCVLFKH